MVQGVVDTLTGQTARNRAVMEEKHRPGQHISIVEKRGNQILSSRDPNYGDPKDVNLIYNTVYKKKNGCMNGNCNVMGGKKQRKSKKYSMRKRRGTKKYGRYM
jgi:hypothetical protein